MTDMKRCGWVVAVVDEGPKTIHGFVGTHDSYDAAYSSAYRLNSAISLKGNLKHLALPTYVNPDHLWGYNPEDLK